MKYIDSYGKAGKTINSYQGTTFWNYAVKIFAVFLILLHTGFVAAQVEIKLKDKWAVCEDDKLYLDDLEPEVSGANGDIWWETSGDGHFSPSIMYPQAETYTFGNNDKANGTVTITLKAREHNPNGQVYEKSAKIYIQSDETFACNDNITVPLNINCEFKVTPPFLLEGENENEPYNQYNIEIYDSNGYVIPDDLITGEYIGQTLQYNIMHNCSWNSCSGTIKVKDNFHPIMACENDTITCQVPTDPDTLGFPIDTSVFHIDTLYKIDTQKYIVRGWDACGDVVLSYQDSVKRYRCDEDSVFQELIVRFWKAVDESGNISRCIDSIRVKKIPLDSIILPRDWDDNDTTALACDGEWKATALDNGAPSPGYTGAPETWYCNNLEYTFTDEILNNCGNTFTVVRYWTLVDFCTSETKVHTQLIKIKDTLAPQMICFDEVDTTGADPYKCQSSIYRLKLPEVYDNCSDYVLFVHVYNLDSGDEVDVHKNNGTYYISGVPLGSYRVEFTAIDQCSNSSSCEYYFDVIDDQRPLPVCDHHTIVSLDANGIARIYPHNIDDGSYDNCGIVASRIRKMTPGCDSTDLDYGDYVSFCCEEIGDTLMVQVEFEDAAGNTNSCMTEVRVSDKLPPQIICPPNIYISCDFYFDLNDLDRYFGTVVTDKDERQDIIIHDFYNSGVVGKDGYAVDNCSVEVTQTQNANINNCNIGTIVRTFIAEDKAGFTNSCKQYITIDNPEPFNEYGDDIIWPKDTIFTGCSNLDADTSITGAPKVNDNMCSMVAIRYEDQLFSVQADACEKIIRKWTVRDWCQSGDLYWTYDQVIMLNNTEGPEFTSSCDDREVCVYGQCEGFVELSASAIDDCTPQEDLVWRWKLDKDLDGEYDEFGIGNHFGKTLPTGTYEIAWVVEDNCGNKNTCTYKFDVVDCKKPTPYCISELTTVMMNNAGMVTIKARDFDHGSYDNCTPSNYGECGCLTKLKFSFSPNLHDTLYTFTCDSLDNGIRQLFVLKMWVTDEAGNQDYCEVSIEVQDNNDVCPDQAGLTIEGTLRKWDDDKPVNGVKVQLLDVYGDERKTSVTQNGRYTFKNVPKGKDYTVEPQDDKTSCLNGVTTLDLVKIQKHILGKKKFDNPYQYIAADANNNKKITSADILVLRKMILGVTNTLSKNNCWLYVNTSDIPDLGDPYNYKNKYEFHQLYSSTGNADFKVVKTGDVNGSFELSGLPQGLNSREDKNFYLVIDNKKLEKGKEVKIPFYLQSGDDTMEGLQFTLNYNAGALQFEGFEGLQINITENNYSKTFLDKGMVTFSWNGTEHLKADKNTPLFNIVFKAKQDMYTLGNISLSGDITPALLVNDNTEYKLNLLVKDTGKQGLTVYQNNPNPFKNETVISFELPEGGAATLEIYDINGKLLYTKTAEFDKGINSFTVNSKDTGEAHGVLYYTLKANGKSVTRKMIQLH